MPEGQLAMSQQSSISSPESSVTLAGGTVTATEETSKWPQHPLPLKKGRLAFALRSFIDFLVLAATVPFIVLAIFAGVKHGKPVDGAEWSKLQTAMKIAVTAFPIIFAAVVGRLTKNVATWRLERGISLGHLEQLLGSSSVFGTLSTQILMGSFNTLAIGLFCLWALSPLGGQSSLHIITTIPNLDVSPNDVFPFNTELPSPFTSINRPLQWLAPQLDGLYVTSLMAPPNVKSSPVDMWGNLKVPYMSLLAANHTSNETGWYNFDAFRKDIPYSSLVGIPVGGLQEKGNTTFNLESSYFEVDCYSLSHSEWVPTTEVLMTSDNPDMSMEMTNRPPKLLMVENNTFYATEDATASFTLGIDSYIDWRSGSLTTLREEGMAPFIKNVTGNEEMFFSRKQTLLFEREVGIPGIEKAATVALCNIKRIYVESAVNCMGDPSTLRKPQCYVTAIRDSQLPHQPSDITPFLFPQALSLFSVTLAKQEGLAGSYSLAEKYMNNTEAPLLVQDIHMDLSKLDKAVFSQRFTEVINTYYFSSLFPSAMVGGLDIDLPVYQVKMYTSSPINHTNAGVATTFVNDLYTTNFAWLTVFLITGAVMLTAAVFSSTLAHFTNIPDILGYASSMARDSLYFPHAFEGSTLDGLTRSQKLKDRKVTLGDVLSDEEIGLLAFSEVDAASRAKKERLYQ